MPSHSRMLYIHKAFPLCAHDGDSSMHSLLQTICHSCRSYNGTAGPQCVIAGAPVEQAPHKHNNFDQYPLIVPQPWELVKNVQLVLIGSRSRTIQQDIHKPCTLPLSPPKGGTKRDIAVFASKIQLLSKEVCCKVSLCENSQRQSYSNIIPLSNDP